mmetsp:Transcript_34822/g.84102  ORF Transcript_34822/g.84102 Transcript_34822/m.84102 type:complete len:317 (+) Transcript_34822:65-1015(+)
MSGGKAPKSKHLVYLGAKASQEQVCHSVLASRESSPYKVLGVEEGDIASCAAAWRHLNLALHPDKCPSDNLRADFDIALQRAAGAWKQIEDQYNQSLSVAAVEEKQKLKDARYEKVSLRWHQVVEEMVLDMADAREEKRREAVAVNRNKIQGKLDKFDRALENWSEMVVWQRRSQFHKGLAETWDVVQRKRMSREHRDEKTFWQFLRPLFVGIPGLRGMKDKDVGRKLKQEVERITREAAESASIIKSQRQELARLDRQNAQLTRERDEVTRERDELTRDRGEWRERAQKYAIQLEAFEEFRQKTLDNLQHLPVIV